MLAFVLDENISPSLMRHLCAKEPALDVVRVIDVGLAGTSDPELLEWAAQANRVVVTHDRNTLVNDAYARIIAGSPMPGIIVLNTSTNISQLVDDLLLLAYCDQPEEIENQVRYIPL